MFKLIKENRFAISQNAGFTLLEVIVASTIIIVGLVGAMTVISKSIAVGDRGVNRLIAANLAQEGIEIIKSLRDISFAANGSWDSWHQNINGGNSGAYTYSVQYNSIVLDSLYNNFLNFDSATGLYSYAPVGGTVTATLFKRRVILEKISDNQLKVKSIIDWSDRGSAQSLEADDMFWNWR